MFFHKHPYSPFIKENTTKLIVGTLPPPRFSTGDLLEKDVDFCYGSYYNSLWLFIDKIHNLNLPFDNSEEAVQQRKAFLIKHQIGVCDIVESAEREKIDASDLGMKNIKLRNVLGYLQQYPNIDTILFTGGNSKNGPEYFFRKHLKDYGLKLKLVSNEVPRIHEFVMPNETDVRLSGPDNYRDETPKNRKIKTVSLTSGSGAANISISRLPLYKQLKAKNPDFNTFDFRVMQYREFF
ncbi:uracil-DNA glycosylase family protein [Tamlana crocina]